MGEILGNSANVYDQDTGELIGYLNPVTNRVSSHTIVKQNADGRLVGAAGALLDFSSRGVAGVTYDVANRVTGFSLGGKNYTVTYGDGVITVDGPRRATATLDPVGRIVSVN